MKEIRLYETSSDFQAYELAAGGDGEATKTVIPGVSYARVQDLVYFNPYEEAPLMHEFTINYENAFGEQISESETRRVLYYSGVKQDFVVVPKNVEGYSFTGGSVTVKIPDVSAITLTYSSPSDSAQPLTFVVVSGGTILWKASNSAYTATISYNKNGGEWSEITSTTAGTQIAVEAGDVLQFKGNNVTYSSGYSRYNHFSATTANMPNLKICGNIMSLLYGDNFIDQFDLPNASSYTFAYLFGQYSQSYYNDSVIDVSNLFLPATSLTEYCYYSLFKGCRYLTGTPPKLPAINLSMGCYYEMFRNCQSLEIAPVLPSLNLEESCYYGMFNTCLKLKRAPELPATTLARWCYYAMFYDCKSLTYAPELPATILAKGCYNQMFYRCSSLTKAMELPASSLTEYCYYSMFAGCSNLIEGPSILPGTGLTGLDYFQMFASCGKLTRAPKLMADEIIPDNCYYSLFNSCELIDIIECQATGVATNGSTYAWVAGVAKNGIFIKNPDAAFWGSGINGIPEGWTVITSNEMAATNENLLFYDESGSTSIKIYNGTGIPWSASTNNAWITLSNTGGTDEITTVNINCESTTSTRSGLITVTNGSTSISINITQMLRTEEYFTFKVLSSAGTGHIQFISASKGALSATTISYKLNDGEWIGYTGRTPARSEKILVRNGDVIRFKGDNTQYAVSTASTGFCYFQTSAITVELCGNIMSLVNSTGFSTAKTLTKTYTFYELFGSSMDNPVKITSIKNFVLPATSLTSSCYLMLFRGQTLLTDASSFELPAEDLATECYRGMFSGCTKIETAPILPATGLANSCYSSMFNSCYSLRNAPNLPATGLANSCYNSMFTKCYSLRNAPNLPALTVPNSGYCGMFYQCSGLTTIPSLPATTIGDYAYYQMFYGCKSLTKAPELPVTTLVNRCYYQMFSGCSSLSEITCLATDVTATACTTNWVAGVNSSGTFYKNPNMSSWTTGTAGIPNGWTVLDATV